jgi:hypothetical protein
MAYTEVTHTPENIFAGDTHVTAVNVTAAASTAIPAYAPVKYDASYNIIPANAIADAVIGILVPDTTGAGIANTAGTKDAVIYKTGEFWADKVDWTVLTAADSDAKKQAVFASTGITLRF